MTPKPALRLQDLPPRWARFCLGIRTFAKRELACDFPALPCLVAVSAGADSTALLVIASLLCRMHGGSVHAVHLNHGLRAEARADEDFVARLCAGLGVPLTVETADVAAHAAGRGIGLEEAGREARYELFEKTRRTTGAKAVLVAHQLNDLAEDQLMRLARGSGWPALGGMPGQDAQRCLLRPLLLTPRTTLEAFLKNSGYSWRVDESNFSREATRNRFRHDLLPGLVTENPAYLDAAARLWRMARVDEAHWNAQINAALAGAQRKSGAILLPAGLLADFTSALRLRLYKAVLDELGPGQALGESLLALDALWTNASSGKALRFPGDKEARISKPGIRFRVIDRKMECG